MDINFKKLIYFGVAYESYDVLDFATDFLAGVRANYFNSGKKQQSNRTVQTVGNNEYSFIYNMEQNKPLSWKIYRNNVILQRAEIIDDNTYVIDTYDSSQHIYKKIYFDNQHIWLKTEYFKTEQNSCDEFVSIVPEVSDENFVIEKTSVSNDSTVKSYLYPKSVMPENKDYSVLAFTNEGFVFFNLTPENSFITKTVIHDDTVDNFGGFNFSQADFDLNRNLNETFDITKVGYLGDDVEAQPQQTYQEIYSDSREEPASNQSVQENYNEEVVLYQNLEEDYAEKSDSNQSTEDNYSSEFCENNDIEKTVVTDVKPQEADNSIESGGEIYNYFGQIDNFGNRTGHGRTVTSSGLTAYEGDYDNDKRNGFGAFYYKNGDISYAGDWKDNKRNGFGIGFRGSDRTSHVGKWIDNTPNGMGVRFDKDGNFIFLGNYVDGKKQGIGITLDENNNFIVSQFEDDEVISSRLLDEK